MTKKTCEFKRLAALAVAAMIVAAPVSLTASADTVPKIALNMETRFGDTVDFGEDGTFMYKDVNPGERPKKIINVRYISLAQYYEETVKIYYSISTASFLTQFYLPEEQYKDGILTGVMWVSGSGTESDPYMPLPLIETSGKCGDNAVFEYSDGVLTIDGSGSLWNDAFNGCPTVDEVRFADSSAIDDLGYNTFYRASVKKITIPAAISTVSDSSLFFSDAATIVFDGGQRCFAYKEFASIPEGSFIVVDKSYTLNLKNKVVFYSEDENMQDTVTRYQEYYDNAVFDQQELLYLARDAGLQWYRYPDEETALTAENAAEVFGSNVVLFKEEYLAPTHTTAGIIEHYKGSDGKLYVEDGLSFKEIVSAEINPLEHDWITSYTWENHNCTAKRVCSYDNSHTEEETAEGVYSIVSPASCDKTGECTYTAEFKNDAFSTQTETADIPAAGHAWGAPEYTWVNHRCTAKHVCENDNSHTEEETAEGIYSVLSPASCEENGVWAYTAEFQNDAFSAQTETADIPAVGHKWGNPVWEWNGRTKATVTLTCENDASHKNTFDAVVGVTVSDDGTETVYTAKVTIDSVTYETSKAEKNTPDEPTDTDDTENTDTATDDTENNTDTSDDTEDNANPSDDTEENTDTSDDTEDSMNTSDNTEDDTDTYNSTEDDTDTSEDIHTSDNTDDTPDESKPDKPTPDEPTPIEVGILGDVNGDGVVDSADALLILRGSVDLETFTNDQKLLANVNGDDTVDSADALSVLRNSVNMIDNEKIGKPVSRIVA